VIAGDDVITAPLDRLLHHSVADRAIGMLRLDIATPMQQIVEATLPIDNAAERGREAEAVSAVHDAVARGELGVAGAADVLRALQNVQVETLVMVDDFTAPGWADYVVGIAGVGAIPDQHPTGGDRSQMTPVPIEDEIIRRAIATGAKIEIVQSSELAPDAATGVSKADAPLPRTDAARRLDAMGGVGALLRFRSAPA
jgi:peptide subunit release factor 1 (eRF1)